MGAFGNVSLLHETRCKTDGTGAINAQVCAVNSLWNFSQRMHPHWTLNSCIAAFRSVWVHFGLFRYCTKLGAKRDELVQLMQKFLPRSHIGIFRNERTRSTPLSLNSCFGVSRIVWMHFGLFCHCTMLDTKRDELVQLMQKLVPRSRIGIFRNERNRSNQLDPKLMFWCVS